MYVNMSVRVIVSFSMVVVQMRHAKAKVGIKTPITLTIVDSNKMNDNVFCNVTV